MDLIGGLRSSWRDEARRSWVIGRCRSGCTGLDTEVQGFWGCFVDLGELVGWLRLGRPRPPRGWGFGVIRRGGRHGGRPFWVVFIEGSRNRSLHVGRDDKVEGLWSCFVGLVWSGRWLRLGRPRPPLGWGFGVLFWDRMALGALLGLHPLAPSSVSTAVKTEEGEPCL